MKLRCIEKYVKCNTVHLALLKKDASTRYNLARNINISEAIQLIIVEYNEHGPKCNIAQNPNVSHKIQSILVKDDNWSVRSCLAKNPKISEDIQIILFGDIDQFVCNSLSENINISEKVQLLILKDQDNTSRILQTTIDLSKNPNISCKAQLMMTGFNLHDINYYLAGNTSISENTQLWLAENGSDFTKSNLIKNPNISEKTRSILNSKGIYAK